MLDTQEGAKRSQGGWGSGGVQKGNHFQAAAFAGRSRLKAIEDYAIAIVGLLLLLPASFLIALAIKLESRGPVLIRQRYQGRDGRMFD